MFKRARWASFASKMGVIGRLEVSYGAAPGCNWTLVYIKEQTWYGRPAGLELGYAHQ